MSDPVELHIDPSKKAEIEFDISIKGIDPEGGMDVRFLLCDVEFARSIMFECRHVDGDKWCVAFPVLNKVLSGEQYTFVLEVIVEDYYFAPASGKVVFISSPKVSLSKDRKKKPKVEASFVVKQDSKEDVKESVVEEVPPIVERTAQAAGDMSSQVAPTATLLTPEFEPDGVPDDEDGGDAENVVDETPEETDFNPSTVAENIIKHTVGGNVKAPSSKGFLFSRTTEGKPLVRGLEDKATKQQLEEKAVKVKQILGSK